MQYLYQRCTRGAYVQVFVTQAVIDTAGPCLCSITEMSMVMFLPVAADADTLPIDSRIPTQCSQRLVQSALSYNMVVCSTDSPPN